MGLHAPSRDWAMSHVESWDLNYWGYRLERAAPIGIEILGVDRVGQGVAHLFAFVLGESVQAPGATHATYCLLQDLKGSTNITRHRVRLFVIWTVSVSPQSVLQSCFGLRFASGLDAKPGQSNQLRLSLF
jgi:hypothetical protein